jgi:hypothetical protein
MPNRMDPEVVTEHDKAGDLRSHNRGAEGSREMEKKCTTDERRLDLLVAALAAVGCCAIIVIALWVPAARAQLILSGLPGVMTMVTARFMQQRQK